MVFANSVSSKATALKLKKGQTYFFCTCGLTSNEPFCDGAHVGTEYRSLRYTANKNGKAKLCTCKASSCLPFCDGSHGKVSKKGLNKQ